ncbi:MAG: translation initiation factor [Betaproteobacteria bacterium]|nr:translation initiation factor [Betaproteobacteria bacterium]
MSNGRKKPIKLDFETQLIRTDSGALGSTRVQIAGEERPRAQTPDTPPQPLGGTVKLRREVKGRAGKPVSVLHGFSDPNAKHSPSLKELQAKLKKKLACGGTFDEVEGTIVLQVDDLKRVRSALEAMGFDVKG